jgi:hypothetical protein
MGYNSRQPLAEDGLCTEAILTAEAARVQFELDYDSVPREVCNTPDVATVDARRSPVAARALGTQRSGLNNQCDSAERRADEMETDGFRVGQESGSIHAALYSSTEW